jgi:predicted AlkP superfamily pyrophosphatase or phosphodiesterase
MPTRHHKDKPMRLAKLFAVFLLCIFLPSAYAEAPARTVIVVLFDGFSPLMMDGVATPNFDRLAREGTSSRHLVPSFPTLSMVNHTTFQTGCWPAHHGIVANEFTDPVLGVYGTKMDRADAAWRTGCESMWQAAERQGAPSAVFNFVGRWSATSGKQASIINDEVPWAQHEDDDTILAKATAALNSGTSRLIALYFDYPDSTAHGDGVHGDKTKLVVAKADAVIGRLLAAIAALPSGREVSLVVGADHGMTKVEKVINIGKLRQLHHFEADVAYGSGSAMLYLKPGQDAAKIARTLARYHATFEVYRKGHFPAYAHIGDSGRVGDLLLITRPPYAFQGPEIMKAEVNARAENATGPAIYEPKEKWFNSMHGFKPDVEAMHAIFYAWGAGITPGKILPRVEMIDVAPTVLNLLSLKPGEGTDGKALDLAH